MVNNNKGSAMLIAVAAIGVLGYLGINAIKSNSNFLSAFSKQANNFSSESLNSVIASTIRYDGACTTAWLSTIDPTDSLDSFVTSKSVPIQLNLPRNITVKSSAVINDYSVTVKSLNLDNLAKVQTKHGFDFFLGELNIQNEMNKKNIKGNNFTQKQKVSDMAILKDKTGKTVACSSSIASLEDNADFLAAKKKAIEDIAKNPQKDSKAVQDLIDLISQQTGQTVTAGDLPPIDSIGSPTATCNSTCQTIQSFYERNIDRFQTVGQPFDVKTATTDLINFANSQNIQIDNFATSYSNLSQYVAIDVMDAYVNANITASNVHDFTYVQNAYADAISSGQTGNAELISHALAEGATMTQVAQNMDSITDKYSSDVISAWFAAGYTLTDAYSAGYLP